jgi:hypothetical protein
MRDKPHLLLVDDDADILGLLEDFFRKQGYEVTVEDRFGKQSKLRRSLHIRPFWKAAMPPTSMRLPRRLSANSNDRCRMHNHWLLI